MPFAIRRAADGRPIRRESKAAHSGTTACILAETAPNVADCEFTQQKMGTGPKHQGPKFTPRAPRILSRHSVHRAHRPRSEETGPTHGGSIASFTTR